MQIGLHLSDLQIKNVKSLISLSKRKSRPQMGAQIMTANIEPPYTVMISRTVKADQYGEKCCVLVCVIRDKSAVRICNRLDSFSLPFH